MDKDSIYNEIGKNFNMHRQADPRLTEHILKLLNLPVGSRIADVGAGTGNYSMALALRGYVINAIEPSSVMIQQGKKHPGIKWINCKAERIPLGADTADASIAILSIHHFGDAGQGLKEMARISRNNRVLLFTFDPRQIETPWLSEYFPFLWIDTFKYFPPVKDVADQLNRITGYETSVHTFDVPYDCMDLFLAAGWRRPEMYLDDNVRSCMSGFAVADKGRVDKGVQMLKKDLETGNWKKKYGWIKKQDTADMGYRFVLSQNIS